jgi:transcription antitermination factor NusG
MNNNFVIDRSDYQWFAVWTRSRQEKVSATMLAAMGVQHFLPLKSEIRQWSDRKQRVDVPLFSGYLFVRINSSRASGLQVLKATGIAGFVGNTSGPLPIPDQQIEDVRTILTRQPDCTVLPFIKKGLRVRVIKGPLAGVEGRLLSSNAASRLLISIEMIHKTLAVSVSPDVIEPIDSPYRLTTQTESEFQTRNLYLNRSDSCLCMVHELEV